MGGSGYDPTFGLQPDLTIPWALQDRRASVCGTGKDARPPINDCAGSHGAYVLDSFAGAALVLVNNKGPERFHEALSFLVGRSRLGG